MRGFLTFLLVAAALVGLLVFVVLPVIAGPVLTNIARDSGVAEDVTVDVDASGPQLLTGTAEGLHLRGQALRLGDALVGSYDLRLGGVSLFDREFDTVQGTLTDVRLTADGRRVRLRSLDVDGPADAARTVAMVDRRESARLIRDALGRSGVPVDRVALQDGRVVLRSGRRSTAARLAVVEGAVVARVGRGRTIELLRLEESDGWRIEEIRVSPDGLTLSGTLDARRFSEDVPGLGGRAGVITEARVASAD